MSMAVDLSTPLTRQEREYLLMRGRVQDVELADSVSGDSTDPALLAGDGTGPDTRPVLTGEVAADRKRQLLAELAAIEEAEQAAAVGSDDSDDVPPYEAWTHKDLDAELKNRQLPGGGTKEEKAQRLYDYDEQTAAPTE